MKIFNRGDKSGNAEAKAPEAAAAPPPPAPPAPPVPDLTAIIDANVKEMSEKIARLATTIESDHTERADFESKLEKMEDRMRKLSSLTEMISAQYNPFVGDAPAEREPLPQPEVGLAAPTPPSMPFPASADPAPVAALFSVPSLPAQAPEPPRAAPEAPAQDQQLARLWAIPAGFSASMVALNWCDMMLKHVPARESVADLVGYYHNIGWVGDPARDQLLAYAEGIAWEPRADAREWRGNVSLHERSLLYIEKLRAFPRGQ